MSLRITFAAFALIAVAALSVALFSASAADRANVLAGKRLFYSAWGETSYACIYCHADFDERRSSEPYRRPAHPLVGVASRPTYFAGAYEGPGGIGLARAVNTCVVAWLRAKPLPASSDELSALLTYLDSISADADAAMINPVPIEKGGAFADAPVGNPRRGENLFHAACTLCHHEGGVAMPYDFTIPRSNRALWNRIRGHRLKEAAGVESPPMKMPFFSVSRLSDQEVADIVSYLEWQFALAVPRHPELPLREKPKPRREPIIVEPESPAASEEAPPPEIESEPESKPDADSPPDEQPAPPPEDTDSGATSESQFDPGSAAFPGGNPSSAAHND